MGNLAHIRSDVEILRSIRATRLHTRPSVTWVIIALNSVCFLVELWLQLQGHHLVGVLDALLPNSSWNTTLVTMGAITPTLFIRGEEWRLVTYMFLHIGVVHFLINMSALPVMGKEIERLYGHLRFLVIYLGSGFIGGIGGWGFLVFTHLPIVMAGASAALYGICMASSMLFLWHHRASHASLRKLVMITLLLYVPFLFIGNPVAHALGACTGMGLAAWFIPRLRKEAQEHQEEVV